MCIDHVIKEILNHSPRPQPPNKTWKKIIDVSSETGTLKLAILKSVSIIRSWLGIAAVTCLSSWDKVDGKNSPTLVRFGWKSEHYIPWKWFKNASPIPIQKCLMSKLLFTFPGVIRRTIGLYSVKLCFRLLWSLFSNCQIDLCSTSARHF